jgi:hypothetical protein
MKRYFYLESIFVLSIMLTGCVTVFVPVDTPTPAPTAIILATLPPPTSTPTAAPTKVQPAPICSVSPSAGVCTAPSAAMLSKSCVKKIPYTLVALSPGSTFEVVDSGITCKDEGLRGGQQQISCTGQQLYSYTLKVCDPVCAAVPLTTDLDRCSDGYGYSAEAGCCWPTSALEAGCVLYKVDIGFCPQ